MSKKAANSRWFGEQNKTDSLKCCWREARDGENTARNINNRPSKSKSSSVNKEDRATCRFITLVPKTVSKISPLARSVNTQLYTMMPWPDRAQPAAQTQTTEANHSLHREKSQLSRLKQTQGRPHRTGFCWSDGAYSE